MTTERTEDAQVAARLLREQLGSIAQRVSRHIHRQVPSFRTLDVNAVEENISAILRATLTLLERGERRTLERVSHDVVALRSAAGMPAADVMLAGLCFLPAVRQAMVRSEVGLAQALGAYEAFERRVLPVLALLAGGIQKLEDLSDPGAGEARWTEAAFPPVSADEQAEDTLRTPLTRRRTPDRA
ncbi:MAG: hypothetical protein ACO3JL_03150 [Myxococcota bacterium]